MGREDFLQDGKYAVNGNIIISDVITNFPAASVVMRSYGLHCVGCSASKFDTIREGCKLHRMKDEVIEQLIIDVNKIINSPIDLSEEALKRIKDHQIQEKTTLPLRITAARAGKQTNFAMDYDRQQENDILITLDGVAIVIDRKQEPYLAGVRIDFDEKQGGFIFAEPSSETRCCSALEASPTHQA